MPKTIWTTKTRRPQDYELAEEPAGEYPPAMKKQARDLEAKILQVMAVKKQAPAKPVR